MTARRAAVGFHGGQVLSLRITEDKLNALREALNARAASAGTRSRPRTAPSPRPRAGRLPARRVRRAPRRLLSPGRRCPAPRSARTRSTSRSTGGRARSRARRTRALGAALFAARRARRGLAGARARRRDGRRRAPPPLDARDRRGRRGLHDVDVDQARRRPPAPGGRGPAAPDGHAHGPLLPLLPRHVELRGGARVRPAAAARPAVRAPRWRWASRGSTWASTTRPTSPPARRSGRSLGSARAMMKVGIVGMPNAGKSSLFNALSRAGAEAANYPFTTIEPNVAVVPVRDPRLEAVAATVGASTSSRTRSSSTTSPASWPARTAARGSATSSWRTSARPTRSLHVVRAHGDENVIHPEGRVDPAADIETIETELIYADLEQAERRHARLVRDARSGDKTAVAEEAWLRSVIDAAPARRAGPRRAGARRRAGGDAQPLPAHGQARALRGQRRRGHGALAAVPRGGGSRGRRRRRGRGGVGAHRGRALRARRRRGRRDARGARRGRDRARPRRARAPSACST